MKRFSRTLRGFSAFLFLAVLVAGGVSLGLAAPTAKPHIVYLLADDLGWGDVGFHGGEIKTPNIDKLAARGTRLEQFYVLPVCSPTRAALMTGRYPMRHGLQVSVVRPWAKYGLPLEERTLPQALKEAGYFTAIVGKWHLGHCAPAYQPTHRGFDHQYGHYNGMLDYFTHIRDGGHDWHKDDKACYDEGYTTHLIAKESVKIIESHDASRPLFLYVPFNAVHSPWQVPEKYMEPYKHLPGNRRIYAGMLAAMDEGIGQILDALEKKGMLANTLIAFSSDNGGPEPGVVTSNGQFRAGKATLYEGGVRVVACATWPGHIPAGAVVNEPLHIVDWYPTLLNLAGVSVQQKLPLDGRDMWDTLTKGKPSPHDYILHNTTPWAGSLRVGDWKLVINGMKGAYEGPQNAAPKAKKKKVEEPGEVVELFNMAKDPYEKNNLAPVMPDKVKELRSRYNSLAAQAVPPKFEPAGQNFKAPKVWGEDD